MSHKIKLLDRRSGLEMDFELEHLGAYVERLVDDGKWIYRKTFLPTQIWSDGTHVFEYHRSKRLRKS